MAYACSAVVATASTRSSNIIDAPLCGWVGTLVHETRPKAERMEVTAAMNDMSVSDVSEEAGPAPVETSAAAPVEPSDFAKEHFTGYLPMGFLAAH